MSERQRMRMRGAVVMSRSYVYLTWVVRVRRGWLEYRVGWAQEAGRGEKGSGREGGRDGGGEGVRWSAMSGVIEEDLYVYIYQYRASCLRCTWVT